MTAISIRSENNIIENIGPIHKFARLIFRQFYLNPPPVIERIIQKFIVTKFCSEIRKKYPFTISRLVDFSFSFELIPFVRLTRAYTFLSIRPLQKKDEIIVLLKIIKSMNPQNVLEIGTFQGGTLFLFSKVSSDNAQIISINKPSESGSANTWIYPKWKIPLYKSFARKRQKVHLIKGDSHDYATQKKVKKLLNGKKIQFLFIDGDHTYEGVKKDFDMYAKFTDQGSLIAFHDIIGLSRNVGEVPRFWNEIKNRYENMEIIKDHKQDGAGIGIIII